MVYEKNVFLSDVIIFMTSFVLVQEVFANLDESVTLSTVLMGKD